MEKPIQRRAFDENDRNALTPWAQKAELNVREIPRLTTVTATEPDDIQVLIQLLGILWKHRWILALALLLGGSAGLAISLWTIPLYRATASVEIQNVQELFNNPVVTSNPAVATQAQLITSSAVRQKAVSSLKGRNSTQKIDISGPLDAVRKALRLPDPGSSIDWDTAVAVAAGAFTINAPKEGNIIYLHADSPNPEVSAAFVNTLAQEYLNKNQDERWEAYQSTGSWLARAQEDLKNKLRESEVRLADFAKSKGLLYTSGSDNAAEDKLKQLQTTLLNASAERITKQAAYEASLSSPTEALPSVLDSGPMIGYQIKLADLRRELAELSTTLTPAHYRAQQVQAQIEQVQQEATKERTNIINRIRIEYDAAVKRESQLRRDFDSQRQVLASQSGDGIQYSILLHEVETNRKLYESTLSQAKEATLTSAMRTSGAKIVDTASIPHAPVTPALPVYVGLGMFGGVLCGAVIVVVRVRSDMRIQAPGAVESQLNLRELGVIPVATTNRITRLLPNRDLGSSKTVSKNTIGVINGLRKGHIETSDIALATWNAKPSMIAEAFRSLMTSIVYAGQGNSRPQVLLVTSASPKEGKSTVVSNLGIALAEIGHRVLLIDADMRLPRLHTIFDLPNTFGLSDILHDVKSMEEYPDESLVRRTEIPGLDVLPAGPARATLPRLLHSARVSELLARLRRSYDTILVDSPPVLSVPDARSLSYAADAVVLVARAHKTEQDSLFAAARCFIDDHQRILGIILNGWNPKTAAYGAYHSYGGYYSRSPYGKYPN